MEADKLQQILADQRLYVDGKGGMRAHLSGADLSDAYLSGADLRDADLRGADLSGADLRDADLKRAKRSKTVLDPTITPNGDVAGFARKGRFVFGYRSANSCCMNETFEYVVGKRYVASVFSVADTECHPGLYLFPTLEAAQEFGKDRTVPGYIKCRALASHGHRAGNKWRFKAFTVVEKVTQPAGERSGG